MDSQVVDLRFRWIYKDNKKDTYIMHVYFYIVSLNTNCHRDIRLLDQRIFMYFSTILFSYEVVELKLIERYITTL